MKTYIEIESKQVDLESHLSKARTIITLGGIGKSRTDNGEQGVQKASVHDCNTLVIFVWVDA